MFRLVKLAAYGLLGYFLYELVTGLTEDGPKDVAARQSRIPRRNDQPRRVPVGDGSGLERTQQVGRGVIS